MRIFEHNGYFFMQHPSVNMDVVRSKYTDEHGQEYSLVAIVQFISEAKAKEVFPELKQLVHEPVHDQYKKPVVVQVIFATYKEAIIHHVEFNYKFDPAMTVVMQKIEKSAELKVNQVVKAIIGKQWLPDDYNSFIEAVWGALMSHSIHSHRNRPLSSSDTIDILTTEGVGILCCMGSTKVHVERQIKKFLKYTAVQSLVVIVSKDMKFDIHSDKIIKTLHI